MKPKLLLLMLLMSGLSFSQVPTDYVAKYHFNSGNLTNEAAPGNGDISAPITPIFTPDRSQISNNALNANNVRHTGYTMPNTGGTIVNEIALSFWVNMQNEQVTATLEERVVDYVNANQNGVSFGVDPSGNFYASSQIGNTVRRRVFSDVNLASNNWNHIFIQFRRSGSAFLADVFINGIRNTVLSNDITINGAGSANLFVQNPNQNGEFIINGSSNFSGFIDDIKIYHRVLGTAEVQALASETASSNGIVYVDKNATGNNNGASWADAYTSINAAIIGTGVNGEIWVTQDTYYPTTDGNQQTPFLINKNLTIRGGFDGTEQALTDRDLAANGNTVLSGDLAQNDSNLAPITTPSSNDPNKTDNSYTVLRIAANAPNVLIDGFTIRDGYAIQATNDVDVTGNGGGIYIDTNVYDANIRFTNCNIFRNYAVLTGGGFYYHLINSSNVNSQANTVTFEKCAFSYNYAREGAGMFVRSSTSNVDVKVYNSLFYKNASGATTVNGSVVLGAGAGIYGSSMLLVNSGSVNTTISATVTNNTFAFNAELDNGNTISDNDRSTFVIRNLDSNGAFSEIDLYNNIFSDNRYDLISTLPSPVSFALSAATPDLQISHCADINNFSAIPASLKSNLITGAVTFSNVNTDDYELTSTSAGIDVGSNTFIQGVSNDEDFLGRQRIFNSIVDLGALEFGSSVLGIIDFNDNRNELFKVFPNPVSTELTVLSKNIEVSKIEIYSLLGEKVMETKRNVLDLSGLVKGVYFIRINDINGSETVQKIIKK